MNEEKRKTEAESRLLHFLSQHHLRRTPERMMILGKIVGLRGSFTSASLLSALADDGFHLSHGTVYNSLRLFESAGLVRRRPGSGSSELYEYAGRDNEHVTLVCTHCGRTREIKDAEFSREMKLRRFPSFIMTGFDLFVHGLCSRCRSGGRRRKQE